MSTKLNVIINYKILVGLLCFCLSGSVFASSLTQGKIPQSWQECDATVKDTVNQVQEMNVYYFRLALCRAEFITNEERFSDVADLFKKATIPSSISFAPQSFFALGYLYESKYRNGDVLYGVSKGKPDDLSSAMSHYVMASKLGCVLADYHLGTLYLNSLNHQQAVFWLTKAAKEGNAAAQYELSRLYQQGIGVKRDTVLAYVWHRIALMTQIQYNASLTSSPLRQRYLKMEQTQTESLYHALSVEQQKQANVLVDNYSQQAVKKSSEVEEACQAMQTILAGNSLRQTLLKLNTMNNK